MALAIREHVDLKSHSTFRLGGRARYWAEVGSEDELMAVKKFARGVNLPLFILGGGSNVIFREGILPMVFVKIMIKGFKVVENNSDYSLIEIGAGEKWDDVVAKSVELGLSGIEAMSAIPGTAGATPVQNVGAYGQEIKDTLVKLSAFDFKKGEMKTLINKECDFRYRDSIFRSSAKGRYLITKIFLKLLKKPPGVPNYPAVKKYFSDRGITNPTLKEIREAIISIRAVRLPDPANMPNVGSFFKNPIVAREELEKIKLSHPNVLFFELENKQVKIPAGWLIEQCEFKGRDFGRLAVYDQNALVLLNKDGASFAELENLKNMIQEKVFQKFGLHLEPEPIFVG